MPHENLPDPFTPSDVITCSWLGGKKEIWITVEWKSTKGSTVFKKPIERSIDVVKKAARIINQSN